MHFATILLLAIYPTEIHVQTFKFKATYYFIIWNNNNNKKKDTT